MAGRDDHPERWREARDLEDDWPAQLREIDILEGAPGVGDRWLDPDGHEAAEYARDMDAQRHRRGL